MTSTRKIVLGAGALLLPLTTIFMIGAGQAWAKKGPQPGSLACSSITGSFKFNPPLFATATATSETATVKSTVSGCVATGGTAPSKGTTTNTVTYTSNGCLAVLQAPAKSVTLTTKWSPGSISPTVVTFPPATGTTSPITLSYGGAGT